MDKVIQAVDIAAATSGNKGKSPKSPAEGGETTPFAEVLAPASQQTAQAGKEQVAGNGGSGLPASEQDLPAEQPPVTVLTEAPEQMLLPSVTAATAESAVQSGLPVSTSLPAEPSATTTTAQPAVQETQEMLTTGRDVPVSQSTVTADRPPVDTGLRMSSGSVPAADDSLMPGNTTRNAHRHDPGIALQAQQQPVQSAGQGTSAAEVVAADVRASVQQALSAQVAQDGLRQSLNGGRQDGRLLGAVAGNSHAVEPAVASFTSHLTEVASVTGASRISVPVGEPGWTRAVGEQVVWHVSQNIQSASLRLNPQHLGPLEMQVQMDGDKATLAFASQHAVVRDALESALPRLREMFAQNGLDIVDVNVSQQNAHDREQQATASGGHGPDAGNEQVMTGEQPAAALTSATESVGLVDYYI